MTAQRTVILAAGAAMACLVAGSPALAQPGDTAVLSIMRECAKIEDPTARLACYDNNVRAGGATGQRPVVPGQGAPVAGGGAVAGSRSGNVAAQGFGAESVKTAERFESSEARGLGPDSISARVTSVKPREPGVYLITLEGGAQWLFAEAAGRSFNPPSKGDTVEIMRASLGSFLMRFDNQVSIRVRRVK